MEIEVGRGHKKILRGILEYMMRNRGIGHTRAALLGAAHTGCIYVTATEAHAKQLKAAHPGLEAVGIESLEPKLMGRRAPLVLDHFVFDVLFQQITTLELELAKEKGKRLKLLKEIRRALIEAEA